MTLRRLATALALSVFVTASPNTASAQTLQTKPIAAPFLLGTTHFIVHIKSIETVPAADSRPFLKKMNDCGGGKGYIMMRASVQNNGDGKLGIPTLDLDYELADASHLSGPQADGYFIDPSLAPVPQYLYPKEHLDLLYVTCSWSRQPITKLIVSNRVRFLVPASFVKADAAPAAVPSP